MRRVKRTLSETQRSAVRRSATRPDVAHVVRAALRLALLRVCPADRAALKARHAAQARAVLVTRFGLRTTTVDDALRADRAARIEAACTSVAWRRHAAEPAVADEAHAALRVRRARRSRRQTHAIATDVVLTNSVATVRVAVAREAIELASRATADAVVAGSRTTIEGRSTHGSIRETLLEAARERVRIAEAPATFEAVHAGQTIGQTHGVDANVRRAHARATFLVDVAPEVVR